MTTQDDNRASVEAAMRRKGLTCKDVARRTGLCERTVQRFVRGETYNLRTLDRLVYALRVEVGNRNAAIVRKMPQPPVVGWEQAANVLGVSVDTLCRRRKAHGQMDREAWWASEAACREWYQGMFGEEG